MPPPSATKIFLRTVDDQLSANDPIFVQTTITRLDNSGYTVQQSKIMIAGVIAHLMSESIINDIPFSNTNYKRLLDQLPQLP